MTIQELFDELRREPDWTKEVVVMCDGDFIPVSHIVPNIIDDENLIIGIDRKEEANA